MPNKQSLSRRLLFGLSVAKWSVAKWSDATEAEAASRQFPCLIPSLVPRR